MDFNGGRIRARADVLLVEDSPHHVRLMREAFREVKAPVNLHVVDDGVEALEFLRHQGAKTAAPRPDLILLDLNMPRMDGRELLANIKSDLDLMTIPTIVLTTSESDDDIARCFQLHANSYLKKPLGWDAFVSMVNRMNDFWLAQSELPLRSPNSSAASGNERLN